MFPLINQNIDKYQQKEKERVAKLKHTSDHTNFFVDA